MEKKELATVPAIAPEKSLTFYERFADPMQAVTAFGQMLAQSQMFGALTPAQGNVLAWHLFTKKKDPFEFLREYHILGDGKITKRADAMTADFLRRGGKIKLLSDLMDAKEAKAEFQKDGNSYTWSFKVEDANGWRYGGKGGDRYLKTNWANSTPDMLRARLFSKAIRILDPEINTGLYTPEEVTDGLAEPVPQAERPAQDLFGRTPEADKVPDAPVTDQNKAAESKTEEKPGTVVNVEPAIEPEKNAADHRNDIIRQCMDLKLSADNLDKYAQFKKWVKPGEPFPFISDVVTMQIMDNFMLFVKSFQQWEKKQATAQTAGTK
jgi:hypothetical protein